MSHIVGAKLLFNVCQTVSSLPFFRDSSKQTGTDYLFFKQAASSNDPT